MRKIPRSYGRWNPQKVHPKAQSCMENCYLKKTIKFDKHLFTPELVSVLVYPCSHCRHQNRSPFLSPEWQTQPLTLIHFNSAVLLQTTGPTYSCHFLTVVTQNRNCITFFSFVPFFFFFCFSPFSLLLSSSNFSLLMFIWETFTHPGIFNQQD